MKHIPLKIFIMVMFAGVVGIVGMIIMKNNTETLSDSYQEISANYMNNIICTTKIRALLYSHQSIVGKHISADTEEKFTEYEQEAAQEEQELSELLTALGERMSGGSREQIFHKAYTSYYSYLRNAQVALEFSRAGNKGTANYYVVNIMDDFVKNTNDSLDDLDGLAESEIMEAQERMEGYIRMSQLSSAICIIAIAGAVIICLVYCVRITSNLDKYKTDLERDVERKSKALREHSEKMLRIQNNTIIGMANLIESRDGETGEHVKRTSFYVNMLAKAALHEGYHTEILNDNYIELLTKAAPLHDIGKISVPDSILQKPGKLTPDEFERIKNHAPEGGRMIRGVLGGIEEKEYVDIAADVAQYHHEKWDGTGYRKGLSGEDIPLGARIMAIADVFDALISKRCYKSPMPLDEAFSIIKNSAGSHFDPTLAGIFLSRRGTIEEYLEENPVSSLADTKPV